MERRQADMWVWTLDGRIEVILARGKLAVGVGDGTARRHAAGRRKPHAPNSQVREERTRLVVLAVEVGGCWPW